MHDKFDDYEQRLRHALQRVPAPDADADDVLARVQDGVRRRVRRRRIGAASLSVAAVLAAAAVVVPSLNTGTSQVADPAPHRDRGTHGKRAATLQSPAPGRLHVPDRHTSGNGDAPGKAISPSKLSVAAVATNRNGATSLIAKTDCPSGPCIVTGSPTNATHYRIAPTSGQLLQSRKWSTSNTVASKPGIQIGSNPRNSWAWTDALYSSHDSGQTWNPVQLPAAVDVEDVQSTEGRVWAFGVDPQGRPAVASSAEDTDDWVSEQVPVHADEKIDTPMVVSGRIAFVATDQDSDSSVLVHQTGDGWQRESVPCPEPVRSSGTQDTVWLGCRTSSGSDFVLSKADDATDWDIQPVRHKHLTAVGGVNEHTAVAAAGDDMLVVNSNGATRQAQTNQPPTGSNDGYNSIRMGRNGNGFATTTDGELFQTRDGGNTWHTAKLP